ncbi:MAG: glycosyltransferase family 39 protein [Deltaproteobacteria bacterium]|nr:glycosyltransferase family 39 protein [Deltaproteobacteria bacterium]
MRSKHSLAAVFFLVAVTVLTRLPLFWTSFLDVDEVLFALFTKIWQMGGIPYVACVETKAMGVYLFYLFASWLSGSLPHVNMTAVHFLSVIWTLLTAWSIYRLGTRLFSARLSTLAALFFVIFTTTYIPKIVATNIEVVLLLPLCLSVLSLLRPPSLLQYRHSFWAGLMLSAAILCKYQSGILLPAFLIYYWLILRRSPDWSRKAAFFHTLFLSLAMLPLPIFMVAYLYKVGGLEGFFFWNFKGNAFYIQSGADSIKWSAALLWRVVPFVAATGLLWFLAGERFIHTLKRWRIKSIDSFSQEALIWVWFFLSFIPVAIGRRFYPHYFLLLLPSLSLLAAGAFENWTVTRWRRWRVVVVLAILAPTIGFTTARYLSGSVLAMISSADDLDLFKPYAGYLKTNSQPEDRILVWGFAPSVYWEAERLPATRFLTSGYLSGKVFGTANYKGEEEADSSDPVIMKEAWDLFLEDLQKHPPTLIMDMSPTGLDDYTDYPIERYPRLMEFISQHYVKEAPFQKATVFRIR